MRQLLFFVILVILLPSCYAVRAYRFRKFELDDLDKFKALTVKKSDKPFHFAYAQNKRNKLRAYLDSNLANSDTYGFLVIQNDSILYEKYFDDLDTEDVYPSFSVAKSYVATLAQIALQEGYIKSFQEPVTNYLPVLSKADKRWTKVSVQNVLDMRTGVKSDETYNSPFSDVIRLGFTANLSSRLKKIEIGDNPGSFEYKSVNTQLLAAVIEAATKQAIPEYLQKKIWQPLGMESDATWQTDRKGTARAFCCLNATLKDFAKLGRLYLNKGNWNGRQILSEDWVATILNADTMRAYQGYKNQWWSSRVIRRFSDSTAAAEFISAQGNDWYLGKGRRRGAVFYSAYNNLPAVFAQGMLGQYVYIHPSQNLIIVRMGHSWKHPRLYAQRFIEDLAARISRDDF